MTNSSFTEIVLDGRTTTETVRKVDVALFMVGDGDEKRTVRLPHEYADSFQSCLDMVLESALRPHPEETFGYEPAVFNCASFVHDVIGVGFDRSLVGSPTGIGKWKYAQMSRIVPPKFEPGEAVVLTRPFDEGLEGLDYHILRSARHWAVAVGPDTLISVNGFNNSEITIASLADLKAVYGVQDHFIATPLTATMEGV